MMIIINKGGFMLEIFKNKYVKTISIVLAGLFLSNILGYFIIGLILAALCYFYLKKSKGGQVVAYEEDQKTEDDGFQANLEATIDKIKKLQKGR